MVFYDIIDLINGRLLTTLSTIIAQSHLLYTHLYTDFIMVQE